MSVSSSLPVFFCLLAILQATAHRGPCLSPSSYLFTPAHSVLLSLQRFDSHPRTEIGWANVRPCQLGLLLCCWPLIDTPSSTHTQRLLVLLASCPSCPPPGSPPSFQHSFFLRPNALKRFLIVAPQALLLPTSIPGVIPPYSDQVRLMRVTVDICTD